MVDSRVRIIADVVEWIYGAALARDNNRVDDRGAIARVGVADEEEVFLSDGRGPDRVFEKIGVEAGVAVIAVSGQGVPLPKQIPARFPEAGLRQRPARQEQGGFPQQCKRLAGDPIGEK